MKKILVALFLNLFISHNLYAQIKMDGWYIYNSSDFDMVVNKISKSLGGRPEITQNNGDKTATWELKKTDKGHQKYLVYGKSNENIAFVMWRYDIYTNQEDAKQLFDEIYQKIRKEEGSKGMLVEEEKGVNSFTKYYWHKNEYTLRLSLISTLDSDLLLDVWYITEAKFSKK